MEVKEKIWCNEVSMLYPKQWIVMTNCEWKPHSRLYGIIYLVTDDENEARKIWSELKENGNMGRVTVVEGFNDTPQIGGLQVCPQ